MRVGITHQAANHEAPAPHPEAEDSFVKRNSGILTTTVGAGVGALGFAMGLLSSPAIVLGAAAGFIAHKIGGSAKKSPAPPVKKQPVPKKNTRKVASTESGMTNLGNTCYFNAAMQLLSRSGDVTEALRSTIAIDLPSTSHLENTKANLATALNDLFTFMGKGGGVNKADGQIQKAMKAYDQFADAKLYDSNLSETAVNAKRATLNKVKEKLRSPQEPKIRDDLNQESARLTKELEVATDLARLPHKDACIQLRRTMRVSTRTGTLTQEGWNLSNEMGFATQVIDVVRNSLGLEAPEAFIGAESLTDFIEKHTTKAFLSVSVGVSAGVRRGDVLKIANLDTSNFTLKSAVINLDSTHFYTYVVKNGFWYKLDDAVVTKLDEAGIQEAQKDIVKRAEVLNFERKV